MVGEDISNSEKSDMFMFADSTAAGHLAIGVTFSHMVVRDGRIFCIC